MISEKCNVFGGLDDKLGDLSNEHIISTVPDRWDQIDHLDMKSPINFPSVDMNTKFSAICVLLGHKGLFPCQPNLERSRPYRILCSVFLGTADDVF